MIISIVETLLGVEGEGSDVGSGGGGHDGGVKRKQVVMNVI